MSAIMCPVCEREIQRNGSCKRIPCRNCGLTYWIDQDDKPEMAEVLKVVDSGVLGGFNANQLHEEASKRWMECFTRR